MKLNIYVFDQEKLDGAEYFNMPLKYYINLDNLVDDGICDEIRLNISLNYLELDEIEGFFRHIVEKLDHGGTVNASSLDIIDICRDVYYRNMHSQDTNDVVTIANRLLFKGTKNALCLEYLIELFEKHGLEVTRKKVIDYGCHVTGKFSIQPDQN